MPARSLFVGGTSSNAGKSFVTTAICASLRRQGIAVAPFKAQNMSNNSFPCRDGGEIGRAQVAQAQACGLEPETAMNPILLKPNGDGTSQVVLRGRMWKTLPARGYYEHFDVLLPEVLAAYHDLSSRFEVDRHRGRRQRQRAEPAAIRPGQSRSGDADRRAVGARRRHRTRRRVCVGHRHGVAAHAGGARAVPRFSDQQVPRRPDALRVRGAAARIEDAARRASACSHTPPTSRSTRKTVSRSIRAAERASRRAPASRSSVCRASPTRTDFRLLTWADWIDAPAGRSTTTSSSCRAPNTRSPISRGCVRRGSTRGFTTSTGAARP